MFVNLYYKDEKKNDYTILADERISSIKEKLFYKTRIYLPEYTRLEYNGETLNNDTTLVSVIKQTDERILEYRIEIITLLDELDTFEIQTSEFDDLFEKYVKDYDLTDDLFKAAISIKIRQDDNLKRSSMFSSESIEYFKDYINEKITNVSKEMQKNSYTMLDKLHNEIKLQYSDVNDFKYIYTNMNVRIMGDTSSFVDIQYLFDTIKLNNRIPFVSIYNENTRRPQIKLFDGTKDNINKRILKSWVFGDSNKSNKTLKRTKDFTLYFYDNGYHKFNISKNGSISFKMDIEKEKVDDKDLFLKLKTYINIIIEVLNSNLTIDDTKIAKIDINDIIIDNYNVDVFTNKFISKTKLKDNMSYTFIQDSMFKLKPIMSDEYVSCIYTRSDNNLSVSIRDNYYKNDSSIISISKVRNILEMRVIYNEIMAIERMSLENEDDDAFVFEIEEDTQKVKEINKIKEIRKQGVNITSTKCQGDRQPIVNGDHELLDGSYPLQYNGSKYTCNKEEYKFPGFTADNMPCCFKKDQRSRENFIRNTDNQLDIIVQVSNMPVKVTYMNRPISTFPIKMTDNTVYTGDYYFIGLDNELVEIQNENIVELLDGEDNIWLEATPLNQILNDPPTNKCNFLPDMSKNTPFDNNKVCEHHEENKFFGYNVNSYPCCFKEPRKGTVVKTNKSAKISLQHILKTDKILNINRVGELPEYINLLLKGFHRLGSNSTFINCVNTIINNTYTSTNDNENERVNIKDVLVKYLQENPNVFIKLNDGNISRQFKNIDSYIEHISSPSKLKKMSYENLIELVEDVLLCNIYIISVDIIEKENTRTNQMVYDYQNATINCNNKMYDKNLVLLKRGDVFEVIIKISDPIKFIFKNTEINSLIAFSKNTCTDIYTIPSNYRFKQLLSIQDIKKDDVKAQILSPINKVEMLLMKDNTILPIIQTGLKDTFPYVSFNDIIYWGDLADYKSYVKNDSVIGVTLVKGTRMVDSVLTKYGVHVPVKISLLESAIPVLDYYYYPLVEGESGDSNVSSFMEWLSNFDKLVYKTKIYLGRLFVVKKQLADEIKTIVTTPMSKMDMFNKILEKLKTIPQIQSKYNNIEFVLKIITNDIMLDNIRFSILNNNIPKLKTITENSNETIITNSVDFLNWFKRN